MKKYDCNNAVDFWHEAARMCAFMNTKHEDCKRPCPFAECKFYLEIDAKNPLTQDDIRRLQEWSDKTPEIKRAERFMDLIKGTEFEGAFNLVKFGEPEELDLRCLVSVSWWNE